MVVLAQHGPTKHSTDGINMQWWVIGFFAAEPESISQDINGEPPTSIEYIPGTLAEAKAAAAIAVNGRYFGPYATKAAAQAAVAAKGPGALVGNQSAAGRTIAGATGLNPAQAISAIWSKLDNRGTWIRIAEGALGLALILVAIAHMTGADSVANLPAAVAKQARKVSKS